MEPKPRELYPKRVVREVDASAARETLSLRVDAKPVKVGVAPAHRRLKDTVKRAETGLAVHQETPPEQRAEVAQHGTKQVNAAQDRTPNRVDTIEVYVAHAARGGWWLAGRQPRRLQAPPSRCARFLTLSM